MSQKERSFKGNRQDANTARVVGGIVSIGDIVKTEKSQVVTITVVINNIDNFPKNKSQYQDVRLAGYLVDKIERYGVTPGDRITVFGTNQTSSYILKDENGEDVIVKGKKVYMKNHIVHADDAVFEVRKPAAKKTSSEESGVEKAQAQSEPVAEDNPVEEVNVDGINFSSDDADSLFGISDDYPM